MLVNWKETKANNSQYATHTHTHRHTHTHIHTRLCATLHGQAVSHPSTAAAAAAEQSQWERLKERRKNKQQTAGSMQQTYKNKQQQSTHIHTHTGTHHNFHVIRFTLIAVNKNADQLTTHRYRNCTQAHPFPTTMYPLLSLAASLRISLRLPVSLLFALSLSLSLASKILRQTNSRAETFLISPRKGRVQAELL